MANLSHPRAVLGALMALSLLACADRAAAMVATEGCVGERAAAVDPFVLYGPEAEYVVLRDGTPIGRHVLTFKRQGADLSVGVRSEMAVRMLGVTLYRFTYEASELWRGGCLISLRAVTDDDGKQSDVSAAFDGQRLVVSGPAGTSAAPLGAFATNHWHPGVLAAGQVINTLRGSVDRVTIREAGVVRRPINGVERAVTAYDYKGDLDNRVYYDADGRWSGMTFAGKDNSTIDFVCVRCKSEVGASR